MFFESVFVDFEMVCVVIFSPSLLIFSWIKVFFKCWKWAIIWNKLWIFFIYLFCLSATNNMKHSQICDYNVDLHMISFWLHRLLWMNNQKQVIEGPQSNTLRFDVINTVKVFISILLPLKKILETIIFLFNIYSDTYR